MTFGPGPPPRARPPPTTTSSPTWLAAAAGEPAARGAREGLEGQRAQGRRRRRRTDLLMRLLAEHRPGRRRPLRGGRRDDNAGATGSQAATGSGSSTRSTAPGSSPSRRATTGPCTSRCGRAATSWPAPSRSPRWARPSAPAAAPVSRRAPRPAPGSRSPRTRPPAFVEALAEELDAELVPMGSAGRQGDLGGPRPHRRLRPRRRSVRVGQRRPGGGGPRGRPVHCSRVDGTPLDYNQDDVSLPDLIVCRPEVFLPLSPGCPGVLALSLPWHRRPRGGPGGRHRDGLRGAGATGARRGRATRRSASSGTSRRIRPGSR